jgi:hypothetical protein
MVGELGEHALPELQGLVERCSYLIKGCFVTPQGRCPSCGVGIPERWDAAFRRQIAARPFVPGMRPDQIWLC